MLPQDKLSNRFLITMGVRIYTNKTGDCLSVCLSVYLFGYGRATPGTIASLY